MTHSIALSLLRQGNNGNEILSILDYIATEGLEVDIIEFWWYNGGGSVILWATLFVSAVIRDGSMWPLTVISAAGEAVIKNANYPNLQRWQFDRAL